MSTCSCISSLVADVAPFFSLDQRLEDVNALGVVVDDLSFDVDAIPQLDFPQIGDVGFQREDRSATGRDIIAAKANPVEKTSTPRSNSTR